MYICDIETNNYDNESEEYWMMHFAIGAFRFSLRLNRADVMRLFGMFFVTRNSSSFVINYMNELRMPTEGRSRIVTVSLKTLNARKQGE